MHQRNWIESLIGVSWAAWPFKRPLMGEWIALPIDDGADALGVLIMGGEL